MRCLDDAMRVLVVTSTFPRWQGDDTTLFILRFAQELMTQGVDVDVLAPHAPGAARAEEVDGVPVERFRYFVPARGEDVCYGGGALFRLEGSPGRVAKLPLLVAAELGAIRARVRGRHYDVVSAHWLLPQGWTAVRASRGAAPVVTTVHGSDVFGLRHPLLRRFKRAGLRGSAAVTVNSTATSEAVATLAPGLPDVRTIPMGVDLGARAEPAQVKAWRDHRTADGPLVAYVGRLVDWKGVDDLLDAAAILHTDRPGLRVVVAGTGPLLESLRARSRALGIDDVVQFPGWLDRGQVTALQTAADVVVAPSRTSPDGSREAQGLSVVEAMALGKPVVAGNVGGIPDAITDGENGLLVAARDPAALAGALTRVASDPELAARLGDAAARTAQRYAWPGIAADFVAVFEDVVSRRRR
jgi:phosphatidyl-myo-inositol dimannoside synthase